MKMTDGERLIAVMLAEIMEALKLNNEIDPKLIKTLVCNNDGWAISHKYLGIFDSKPPLDEHVSETINILWMWGVIEHQLGHLEGDQATEASGWHWAKFRGFDGNHDPHYGIAMTLIKKMDQFDDFRDHPLNSHSQSSLPRYRTMIPKFERHLEATADGQLSFDALRDLCS